jgi:hypothetical protein
LVHSSIDSFERYVFHHCRFSSATNNIARCIPERKRMSSTVAMFSHPLTTLLVALQQETEKVCPPQLPFFSSTNHIARCTPVTKRKRMSYSCHFSHPLTTLRGALQRESESVCLIVATFSHPLITSLGALQ